MLFLTLNFALASPLWNQARTNLNFMICGHFGPWSVWSLVTSDL